jgi:hypothetical protein
LTSPYDILNFLIVLDALDMFHADQFLMGNWMELCGLAITFCTLVALIWQTRDTRRAVNIARSTLVSTFRPKLILRSITLRQGTNIPTHGVPDTHPWKVDYVIANIGGSRAHITMRSFAVSMFEGKELPFPLPYARQAEENAFVLEPGEERELSVGLEENLITLFRHLGVKGGYLDHQRTAFVYFFGFVQYTDDIQITRKIAVLRHYETKTGRFLMVSDPDCEYAD